MLAQDVYEPCPCGSGGKYKFCCRRKEDSGPTKVPGGKSPESRSLSETTALPPDLQEAMKAFHGATGCFEAGHHSRAMSELRRVLEILPDHAPSHDNLAALHFLRGDIEQAIAISERVDREIARDNAFTLGALIHYHLILGREEKARQYLRRLRLVSPHDGDGLCKKCEALARFGDHEAILREAEAGLKKLGDFPGVRYFAGVAATNLCRHEAAKRHLREARHQLPHQDRARLYLRLLEQKRTPKTIDGDWPYLEFFEWVPQGLLDQKGSDEEMRGLPGLVECFVGMMNDHSEDHILLIHAVKSMGTPRARQVLRRIALGTFGNDELRMRAVVALTQMGELKQGAHVRVWHSGGWKEVRVGLVPPDGGLPFPTWEQSGPRQDSL